MTNLNLAFRLFFPPFFAKNLENPREKRFFLHSFCVFSLNVALIILKVTPFTIGKEAWQTESACHSTQFYGENTHFIWPIGF